MSNHYHSGAEWLQSNRKDITVSPLGIDLPLSAIISAINKTPLKPRTPKKEAGKA